MHNGGRPRPKDMEEHRYSAKCPGCSAIVRVAARQGYSRACRKRLEQLVKDSGKVKRACSKLDEFATKVIEKQDEDRRKRARREEEEVQSGCAAGPGLSDEERKSWKLDRVAELATGVTPDEAAKAYLSLPLGAIMGEVGIAP